jgi:YD repeat-containing protein
MAGGAGRDDSPGVAAWRTALGRYWSHDYAERIIEDPDDSHVWLITRFATFREFSNLVGGVYTTVSPSDEFRTLERTGIGWTLTDLDGTVTEFDDDGLWLSTTDRNGNTKAGTYSAAELTTVAFPDGRSEAFTYHLDGKLATITEIGTDGLATLTWGYTWSGDDLVRIDRPDGTAWVFTYDTVLPGYMTLMELEGTDTSRRVEQGWEYDTAGNAYRTWRGAATFTDPDAVDTWELAFDDPVAPTETTVTDPLGQSAVYEIEREPGSGKPRVVSVAGGCPACGLDSDTQLS